MFRNRIPRRDAHFKKCPPAPRIQRTGNRIYAVFHLMEEFDPNVPHGYLVVERPALCHVTWKLDEAVRFMAKYMHEVHPGATGFRNGGRRVLEHRLTDDLYSVVFINELVLDQRTMADVKYGGKICLVAKVPTQCERQHLAHALVGVVRTEVEAIEQFMQLCPEVRDCQKRLHMEDGYYEAIWDREQCEKVGRRRATMLGRNTNCGMYIARIAPKPRN